MYVFKHNTEFFYFEPVTTEDVLQIYEKEKGRKLTLANEFSIENSRVHLFTGRIVCEFWWRQNSVSKPKVCDEDGVNILGTSIDSIDIAEDRDLFRHMMEKLEIPMPESGMEVIYDGNTLREYVDKAVGVTSDRPLLIDRFLKNALECEADALSF